jgi:hypothetical protein
MWINGGARVKSKPRTGLVGTGMEADTRGARIGDYPISPDKLLSTLLVQA